MRRDGESAMSVNNISCPPDFSFADLVAYLSEAGAKVGHSERVTVTTESQRITLVIRVDAIEDIFPKLRLVK